MSLQEYKSIHIPLGGMTHQQLRKIAESLDQSLTTVARMAIEDWIKARQRHQIQKELTRFVAEHAGSEMDLVPSLEKEAMLELQKVFEDR